MKTFTAHLRAHTSPVLVAEGFSFGAFLFGWIWLALHRAWVAAILDLAAWVILLLLVQGPWQPVLAVALAVLQGTLGGDLVRWGLARRGFVLTHVVAARDHDAAFARLLGARPDLLAAAAKGVP